MSDDQKYKPDEIPSSIQATMYTHYCISGYEYGQIKNFAFNATGESYVLIAQTPVFISIPPVGDLKQKVIGALEDEKKKQQADHHKKMFDLQGKIDSLLCLTYQPEGDDGVVIDQTANDIPF